MDTQNLEKIQEMNGGEYTNTEIKQQNQIDSKDNKDLESKNVRMRNLITFIKLFSTLRIMSDDNEPVEILSNLYIGSIGAAKNKESLLKNKITHIVVAGSGLEKNFPNDFVYLKFDLIDSPTQNISRFFDESSEFIHATVQKGGNVLVHCHAGISRSSTLILSYLIKHKKMRLKHALDFVKSKRNKINPNEGFIKQLQMYEDQILGEDNLI